MTEEDLGGPEAGGFHRTWESNPNTARSMGGRGRPLTRRRLLATDKPKTKRWTAKEDRKLVAAIGEADNTGFVRRLPGRTIAAIKKRAQLLGFSLRQGSWSKQKLIRETGYNWKQVERARDALGQHWKRTSYSRSKNRHKRSQRYVITEEQALAIIDYLADEPAPFLTSKGFQRLRWSQKFDRCKNCGTNGTLASQRHNARGYCCHCYYRCVTLVEKNPPKENPCPSTAPQSSLSNPPCALLTPTIPT